MHLGRARSPRSRGFSMRRCILVSIVRGISSMMCATLRRGGDNVDIVKGNMGWIEVIVGPMFSGKSEELIRRLKRAEIARQRVQIFKPVIDQRYAHSDIVSHSGFELASEVAKNAADVFEKVHARTEVVGIDKGQFLGEGFVDICMGLADARNRVSVTVHAPAHVD